MKDEEHIQESLSVLKYSVEQFDKTVVFIASGALGISFAFIKDIVPNLHNALRTGLLMSSWFLFATIIFISLVCHFISVLAQRWAVTNAYIERKKFNKGVESWNFGIRILNVVMIVGVFIGGLLLICFINTNI